MNSNDLSFARSKMYLRQMCPELENSMKCVQTFTLDCLQENQREHFSNLYADTNKMIMELCHDGPFQDEFLKHAQCMQNDSPRHNLCNKKYERITQEIERRNATIVDGSWNHYICCGFREYLDCSQHSVRRQCGDEAAQFTKQLHARMSSSMLRVNI
ncbi:hypothetical protein WN55_00734 [Dufourea novaeangliae]|uniref:Uncharacterized protein n=1 Tax=Dufourea novaeangliae TaxID=178035 RepID=A0A154P077_DUFNO|nr:hypothetical protein WN55_00734 [Dufourea novaeangliae]